MNKQDKIKLLHELSRKLIESVVFAKKNNWSACHSRYYPSDFFLVKTVSQDTVILGRFLINEYLEKGYYAYCVIDITDNLYLPFNLDKKLPDLIKIDSLSIDLN